MATYEITFSRVGRNHNVPPLLTKTAAAGSLDRQILDHTKRWHGSRDRWVTFEGGLERGEGVILCGGRDGGRFTYRKLEPS